MAGWQARPPNLNDPFVTCLDFLNDGEPEKALQYLLTSLQSSYDDFSSEHPCFRCLVNYLDACAFGNYVDVMLANQHLQDSLEKEGQCEKTLFYLRREFRSAFKKKLRPEDRIRHQASWNLFKEKRPKFASLLFSDPSANPAPWIDFHYPSFHFNKVQEEKIPVYLIEPHKGDWEDLKGCPAVFVFESKTHFLQMFQFSEFIEMLDDSLHLIYLLDIYPVDQLQTQPITFTKTLFSEAPFPVTDVMNTFAEKLERLIRNPDASQIATELYRLCYEIRFLLNKHRLGKSRIPALLLRESARSWHDEYKVTPYKPSQKGKVDMRINLEESPPIVWYTSFHRSLIKDTLLQGFWILS